MTRVQFLLKPVPVSLVIAGMAYSDSCCSAGISLKGMSEL